MPETEPDAGSAAAGSVPASGGAAAGSADGEFGAAAPADWLRWIQARDASVRRPHGPLALVATHWLGIGPGERLDGLPGRWSSAGRRVRVTAEASEGLRIADEPVEGQRLLNPDLAEDPTVLTHGARKLVPIVRDGALALRVYDPESANRRTFAGIDRFPHDPALAVPARYEPYVHGHMEQVLNADGNERGLALHGDIVFELGEDEYRLAVTRDGAVLTVTFGDATNGPDTFGFRQLTLAAPAPGTSATVVDFNRATLPPCAFSDHFICPVPPVGNRLSVPIAGGERRRRFHG